MCGCESLVVQERKRLPRNSSPCGSAEQEQATENQQRLAKRRCHNRESARRSRDRRAGLEEDQVAQVPLPPRTIHSDWDGNSEHVSTNSRVLRIKYVLESSEAH